ncbi:capping actin protein of muscle Z-line subunit beta [Homo sapiens]|uniref:Capping actin protein of muscle Z-line subunit beta n=1 Tax=Homo sapiens TaxID=9606 RepID=A0A6I8PIN8_HUMAN|nr:capping actin protein of muscle Z-line subunit beta [Homo sapiens]KAI4078904.1 capping actin protein of muscle Z-line subunit beta [Homo sapiens]
MSDQQLDCALDLMRRLPPQQIEKNLSDLIDLGCACSCFYENLVNWLPCCPCGFSLGSTGKLQH